MDNIDIKILDILNKNPKSTNIEISKKINMSPAATLERVRKLESSKIIKGYKLKINEKKLGFQYSFFIYLRFTKDGMSNLDYIVSDIKLIPQITQAFLISGQYNMIAQINVKTIDEYTDLLKNKLSSNKNIESINECFILNKIIDRQCYI